MRFREFKQLNQDNGNHFFSPDTMRFFNSVIELWDNSGFFITSESFTGEHSDRFYSIRRGDLTSGKVTKISEFQQYKNLDDAEDDMNEMIGDM